MRVHHESLTVNQFSTKVPRAVFSMTGTEATGYPCAKEGIWTPPADYMQMLKKAQNLNVGAKLYSP